MKEARPEKPLSISKSKYLSGNVGVARRHGGGDEAAGVPPAQEPIEWHDMSRKCSDVVSKTFTPADELETVIQQNSVIKNGLPAMSPPWENREDSERDVKMLCDALALFTKSPVYKGRVRQALREAKIIK